MLGQSYRLVKAVSLLTGEEIEFIEPIEVPRFDDRSFEAALHRARLACKMSDHPDRVQL